MPDISIITPSRLIRAAAVTIAFALAMVSTPDLKAELIDADAVKVWQGKLAIAENADDSIAALYNLFDLTKRYDAGVFSCPLLELSSRTMDYTIYLDVLRKVANRNARDQKMMDSLYEVIKEVPASDDQQETLIFIEVRRLQAMLNNMPKDERFRYLYDLVANYRDDPSMPLYSRIRSLYLLTTVLSKTVGGDIYDDYMDRLYLLIKELPDQLGPLSSLYFTQASVSSTLSGEYERGAAINRKLLSIIHSLKARNEANGFAYANYNNNEYSVLRRLITNYPALQQEEIDSCYMRIKELVAIDDELKEEYATVMRVEAFYLVAKKRYAEAVKAIEKALEKEENADYRLRLLQMLIECGEKTANSALLSSARKRYISAMEDWMDRRQDEKITELQLLLDLTTDFRDRLSDSDEDYQHQLASQRIIISILIAVALAAMATAGVMVVRSRKRGRRHQ